jgi:hypothetical protein
VAADEQRVEKVDHPLESVADHFTDHGGEDTARATIDKFYNLNAEVQRADARA